MPTFSAAVAVVEKIRFFSGEVLSRSRLHVTVGTATVMAELLFFGLPDGEGTPAAAAAEGLAVRMGCLGLGGTGSSPAAAAVDAGAAAAAPDIDLHSDYLYQEELYGIEGRPPARATSPASSSVAGAGNQQQQRHYGPQWCYLRFAQPVTAPQDSLIIGSRLDADAHGGSCRLAFYGRLCLVNSVGRAAAADAGGYASGHSQRKPLPQPQPPPKQQAAFDDLQRCLRIFKPKRREGVIERIEADGRMAICRGMFQKETDLSLFSGKEYWRRSRHV